MPANYAHLLVSAAQRLHVTHSRVIFQDALLAHASSKGGMTGLLAQANKNGICAALTVKFVEAAMLGRLAQFSQSSLAESLPSSLSAQLGGSFFSLMSGGTTGNFEISAAHLNPVVTAVAAPDPKTAFMTAMRDAIIKASTSLANTAAISMTGDGGHVVGIKVVPGGTSSFFDANAGLYQFHSVDSLRAFWRAAYDAAEYGFPAFKVVNFTKMPPLQ